MRKNTSGFTIVELLIVIVVIAILAAISVVAYNGIQSRARSVQQVAELDKIGKAIQLWSAETGKSLGSSGAGASGAGLGYFSFRYTAVSVEDLLRSSGYFTGAINTQVISSVLVAPCTTYSDPRWVVLATVSPAPSQSVASQISATGCTSSYLTTYSSGSYTSNLLKAY